MKIWHISDTHELHKQLIVPEVDMVIFSGDCSNSKSPYVNEKEVREFLTWFYQLPIKIKIFVAGNHDTSIEHGLIDRWKFIELGIIYLENESVEIEGIKIWGSPITPTYGDWAFMKARHKLHDLWQTIPADTDIVIVHGPPKNTLDLTYNRSNELEFCGCKALKNRILEIKPKYCLFGHVHNNDDIQNQGMIVLSNSKTIYSNASVVEDGKFEQGVVNNGNIFIYE